MSTARSLRDVHKGQRSEAYFLILPEVIFIFINVLFLTCFHGARWLIWAIVSVSFCAALVMAARGAAVYPITTFALGLWCLLTIVCATVLGLYLNSGYLQHYHELVTGDLREDVDPLSTVVPAAGAMVTTFTNGTFVDDRRTIGFIAQGRIYCVAPVTRRGYPDSKVLYWAAGVDCCEKRSNFDCGTAREAGLLTAISYHTRAEKHFRDAIGVAASVYNITSPAKARLMGFVNDYEEVKDRIWGRALMLMAVGSLVQFVCSALVAMVSRIAGTDSDAAPPPRDEAVERWVEAGCHDLELHHSALEWESFFGCLGPRWRFWSRSIKSELLDIETWERRHRYGRDDVNFFENVFIAQDGGLRHEVKDLVKDVTFSSRVFALVTPACLIYNTIYILKTDILYLQSTEVTVDWCITGFVVDRLAGGFLHFMGSEGSAHVPATIVVAVSELFLLGFKYLMLFYLIVEAQLTSEVRRRWANASKIYWNVLPSLSTFSAMQLLSYVVPSIMRLDMVPKIQMLFEARGDNGQFKAIVSLVVFFVSRLFFAVAGFDAFLVKFRFAITYVEADSLSVQNLLGALGFVLQLVGVVDLAYWNRQRVSNFVFGKADGKLSERERADKHVYNWMLAERIWRYSNGSLWLFSVTMLRFSDIDFQKLVLNEHSRESEGSEVYDAGKEVFQPE